MDDNDTHSSRSRILSVDFRSGDGVTHAVRHVSFDIGNAETVALVGESGSGKTVTALSILKLLPYPAASHPSGKILFNGENLLDCCRERASRRIRGNKISMIFQEPMTSLNPLHTIEQQVGEVLKIHRGMSDRAARERVLDLLGKVGIDDPKGRLQSYPHQLSGGQRQRVMIAMALANEPDLLIADEPTTALDVTIQAQILDLLLKLKDEFNMAMLLITHDLGIVRKMADRVCVMNNGEIVERGATRRHLRPAAASLHQASASPRSPRARRRRPMPRRRPSSRPRICGCGSRSSAASSGTRSAISRRSTASTSPSRKARPSAWSASRVRARPRSGWRCSGWCRAKGPIVYLGNRIDGYDSKRMRPLRRHMQIVFQDPYGSLSPRLSVGQIIEEGLAIQNPGLTRDRARRARGARAERGRARSRRAATAIRTSSPAASASASPSPARSCSSRNSSILDEPTSALDVSVQAQIVDLLRELQRRHKLAYLFISHDLKVVRALANSIIVLRYGKVVEQGPAQTVFANPKTDYTKALLAAAFELEATRGGCGGDLAIRMGTSTRSGRC